MNRKERKRKKLPGASRSLPALVVASLLAVSTACQKTPEGVLIQLPGAQEVKSFRLNGMDVLEYKLRTAYPAEEQITEVQKKLKQRGWKPLSNMFLYPKISSSHVTGWAYFNDPPKDPSWLIYEWSADWQDPNGNVLTYTFRYKDPIEKYRKSVFMLRPVHNEMQVTAIYMPAGVARRKQQLMSGS